MQPRGATDMAARHPLLVLAAFFLLATSFSLAVSDGRLVEAVLLGVFALPPLTFLVAWMLGRR